MDDEDMIPGRNKAAAKESDKKLVEDEHVKQNISNGKGK